jgi:2'-5' RNA ligase
MTELMYSLWLVPPRPMRQQLSGLIRKLAREFSAPPFEPHVTLQWAALPSESDAIDRARRIAKAILPLTVRLGEIRYEASYYRALYYAVDLTDALSSAYETATALFGNSKVAYLPHLSLLYGRYSSGRKAATIKTYRPKSGRSFRVSQLHLLRTTGPVNTWKGVARFPLSRRSKE